MSEVDDALEPENTIYVYQAQIEFTKYDTILVKAYDSRHASDIIEDNYKDHHNFRIIDIRPTTNDITRNILNKTVN